MFNREAGDGRADAICTPKSKRFPGLIFEIKATKKENENLEELATKALEQVEEKEYFREMKTMGFSKINIYGIAFRKKEAELKYKEISF